MSTEPRYELPFCETCDRYFTAVDDVVAHCQWHEGTGAMPLKIIFKLAPETEQN